MTAVEGFSGWDPGNQNSEKGTVPQWMYNKKFGQLNILQLEAEDRSQLNPFLVGKCLEACVGEIEGATTEDDGKRFVLRVRNPDQVRKLLALKELKKGAGHPSVAVAVMLHPTLNKRRCVITCRETQKLSESELLEELRSQGVIAVKRFTHMVNNIKENTPTVALTIEGTIFPEFIKVGPLRIKTRIYIPEPTICFTCYKYGHTKNRCKAAARCRNCSEVHELKDDCKMKPYCLNCKGDHGPSSRKCPIYLAEKEITRIRVTKGVNYSEASKQFNAGAGSYAELLALLVAVVTVVSAQHGHGNHGQGGGFGHGQQGFGGGFGHGQQGHGGHGGHGEFGAHGAQAYGGGHGGHNQGFGGHGGGRQHGHGHGHGRGHH